ncbi:MAG: molecular chaperone TorD family protein [Betaproteobacteria bacterium]|nr:molecular chaperone TorD family protein [Betaproteobacteria bacterium]
MRLVKRQEARAQELLRRATAFRVLAAAFAYPVPGHGRALTEQIRRLAPAAGNGEDRPVARALGRLWRAWAGADEERVRAEYARLFLGSGPVSLHETAYGDGRRIAGRTAELADISGFYLAFGLRPSENDPDLPDHICSELEFYSLMLIKAAYAGRSGWTARSDVTRRALRKFLEQHLGRWTGSLARDIDQHTSAPPYLLLARVLQVLIRSEFRRVGARPTPVTGRFPHDFIQEDAFVCPKALAPA